LLYASDTQVNAIVPYSLASGPSAAATNLTVESGPFSASYAVQGVWKAWPAVFTQGEQAAAINQDGSINSQSNPAPVGSVISLYATGLGALNGPLPDNAMTPLSAPRPGLVEGFGAYIGAPAGNAGAAGMEVWYAGPAPGMPPGVYQLNVRIPAGATLGEAPITLQMDLSDCVGFAPCASPHGPYVWTKGQ
jgi:uncharacterized protein (TIGR03437 family)